MAASIVNAAPMVIDQGTQDLSTRQVPRTPVAVPQHCPKQYTFAQKGPTKPILAVGVDLTNIYGDETFNLQGKFANFNTPYILGANSNGNAQMIQRLIPDDAGPEATIVAWLDVLPTTVDLYTRNSDGSIKIDPASGDPVIAGTAPGFKVKWVVTSYNTVADIQSFGQQTQKNGDQHDPATNVQSTMYPMFEFKASSVGTYGNFSGIRLWAPTSDTTALPTKMMNTAFAYPYVLQMIQRPDAISSPAVVPTVFAEQSMMFTFKPGVIDPLTTAQLYAGDTIINRYQSLGDPNYADIHGNYSELHIYDANIQALVTQFQAAEAPYINQFSDFTADPTQSHLFNFVSGVSSMNVPYSSFIFVDAQNTTRWSASTNVYSQGSSDGTLTDANYSLLVANVMASYSDPLDPVQEMAVNMESIIYDSGFPLATKYALIKFISQRHDTMVILGTYDANDRTLSASEEDSVAIALRTRLQMYPESDYFGTPVMRGLIQGRSGKVRNSLWTKALPMTYERMMAWSAYMGAGNGRWKNGFNTDGAPGSIVKYMTDISITWVPASVRNRNWDVGLNWVQAYDNKSYFFPASKTVYPDDTSVLNAFETVMAICQLNKIAHACWREFAGESHLTDAQLIQRVNDFVNARVSGIFDGRYVIVPDAQVTDMDTLRGFSYTLPISIFSPSMKTVMTTYVQARRISDLGTTTP